MSTEGGGVRSPGAPCGPSPMHAETPPLAVVPPASAGRVEVEEFTSLDALSGMRDVWDEFAASVRAPACLSFDGCAAWWKHYGDRRELAVFVFRSAGRVVGVLPMFVEELGPGPAGLRVAALLGSDSTIPVLDLPLLAECAREVLAVALRRLLVDRGCDAVKFPSLSGESPHLAALRAAVGDAGGAGRVALDAESGVYTAFDLPKTFDGYLAALSSNQRSNYRRKTKSLGKDFAVVLERLTEPAAVAEAFEQFLPLHEEYWRREGKLGHFGDWPGSAAYHRDLLARHAARGRARVLRLSLDGTVAAIQISYTLGERCHWFLPARSPREDLDRYSIGTLGLIQVVEDAIAAGFRELEAGVGRYEYKVQIGAREIPLRTFVVVADRWGPRLRLRAAMGVGRLLHKFYYRGWFLRGAQHFPRLRRPLWRIWIRTRF